MDQTRQHPEKTGKDSNFRKRPGSSGYAFAVGFALVNVQKLMQHNVQPLIVFSVAEESEEDDQGETDDPDVLFQRQLRKIRLGEAVDDLVLRRR